MDVSVQPIGLIFKELLGLRDSTDRLFLNVAKEAHTTLCVTAQKSAGLIHFAAEALNDDLRIFLRSEASSLFVKNLNLLFIKRYVFCECKETL